MSQPCTQNMRGFPWKGRFCSWGMESGKRPSPLYQGPGRTQHSPGSLQKALLRSGSKPQVPLPPWKCHCSRGAHNLHAEALPFPPLRLTCLFEGPQGASHTPEALIFFHLSMRHLFLINVLTLKLCAENEEKETLCGTWDLFKAWGNRFRGCMFFIPFMRDACFPPSVTCLKVKFNMLPEKLLVNNLISYVLGIMGEK